MNQGARLKEERERLGYNQTDFAALVGASKHSQINWEKGVSSPDSAFLEVWAKVGLDVLYVVMGQRTFQQEVGMNLIPVTNDERELIGRLKKMNPAQRNSLLEVSRLYTQPPPDKDVAG
ncbi:helix-turn-helix transcriptional regulator [Salmonella enterica]|nr:helix-turn-helix transcriptional regulator [Salmonella enterica]